MNIKFNLESNPTDGFYALYASLRFFKEYKTQINKNTDAISVPAAECYCMLEDLKAQHPKEYAEAELEYDSVYVSPDTSDWLEFKGENYLKFTEYCESNNCTVKFDDGTVCDSNADMPIAILTHFKKTE